MDKDTIFTLDEYSKGYEWIESNTDYTIKEIEKSNKGERQFCFELKYEVTHKEEIAIENRKFEIQERLNQLSQDFVQVWCGAEIPDINARITEFQLLHNELRILNGKEPRAYLHENVENTENTVDENV